MNELKPCPCCGHENPYTYHGRTWFVFCPECSTRSDSYATEAEAITGWNRRQERTCADDNGFAYGNDAAYWHDEYEKLLRAVDVIRDATERTCHVEKKSDGYGWQCECGNFFPPSVPPRNYCPWCGAKVVNDES